VSMFTTDNDLWGDARNKENDGNIVMHGAKRMMVIQDIEI
jgi:hypothetical protein